MTGTRCKTGSYTGDGAASRVINSGLSEQIGLLMIFEKQTIDNTATPSFVSTPDIAGWNASGGCITRKATGVNQFDTGKITALGSDGKFTIGDNAADESPNRLGTDYAWIAFA